MPELVTKSPAEETRSLHSGVGELWPRDAGETTSLQKMWALPWQPQPLDTGWRRTDLACQEEERAVSLLKPRHEDASERTLVRLIGCELDVVLAYQEPVSLTQPDTAVPRCGRGLGVTLQGGGPWERGERSYLPIPWPPALEFQFLRHKIYSAQVCAFIYYLFLKYLFGCV